MKALTQVWLDRQCRMIQGASQGLLLLGAPDRGPFSPVAQWPEGSRPESELANAAELAMSERRGVIHRHQASGVESGPSWDAIGLPLLVDGQLWGGVAVAVKGVPKAEHRGVLQLLQWGGAWLEVLLLQQSAGAREDLGNVVDLVATALEHRRFQAAATAAVTQLAGRLGCERVSLGFRRGHHCEVRALSHSARFGKKSNLIRDLGEAMDEALDQDSTLVLPAPEGAPPQVLRAHESLAREHGSAALCTIPLSDQGEVRGALCLERAAPFDPATVELGEHVASLIGPILDGRRREDRWLVEKAWESFREQVSHLVGPDHPMLKLCVALVVALGLFLALATGQYRVSATATLEGSVQRAVVAAQEGFIGSAEARAGDVVKAGDVLATLDDRDLTLERLKWAGQRQQRLKEHRSALAEHDRTQVAILSAQLAQADAQLALLDEQLARTTMRAPFDGVVVSGDLSQSLGSPVERGEVLFEIAPLDGYRIILEVDERDIAEVAVGQKGQLALSAMPGDPLPLRVEKITPVSVAEEGRNHFRVEAGLKVPTSLLRPGMEGVGKIEIEERRLLWIWTHRLVDWMRLSLWSWWR